MSGVEEGMHEEQFMIAEKGRVGHVIRRVSAIIEPVLAACAVHNSEKDDEYDDGAI